MDITRLVKLLDGRSSENLRISIKDLGRGVIRETRHMSIIVTSDDGRAEVLRLLVFTGRPPFYRAWIEAYSIREVFSVGHVVHRFLGSWLEELVLDALAATLGPGERLFIEYLYDKETMKMLEVGAPIAATRLGFKLYMRGFRWFKDWYFPEGFMEGGPKLQAEKPVNASHEEELGRVLARELCTFVKEHGGSRDPVVLKAVKRAKKLLASLRHYCA